jgi:hypothetical protein
MKNLICLAALLSALSASPQAHAVTLFVSPDGAQGFIIEGDNIGDAQLVEVTVDYDPSVLSHPRVSIQGGTVAESYDGTPGTLIFRADRGEEHAASFEAHLSFEKLADRPGGINSVTGTTRDLQGKSSSARSSMNLVCQQKGEDGTSDAAAQPAGDSAGEPGEAAGQAAFEAGEVAPAKGNSPAATEPSVLQRFEQYRGRRGLAEFAALFERSGNLALQEPPIALSDGKTPLRVTLVPSGADGETPDVGLSDAQLVSLERGSGSRWVVTALPNEGSSGSALLLKQGGNLAQYPLLVAAPLRMPKDLHQGNFLPALDAFLAEGAAGDKPSARSLREYTFTANFLAGQLVNLSGCGAR